MSFSPDRPLIYLITKGEATPPNFAQTSREILDVIRAAVEEKVSLIQIREKALTARLLFDLTVSAVEITRGSVTRLLVNDRADIALAAGADGVHLATNSLPVDVIRSSFPKGFLVGASTHTLEEAVNASSAADFAVLGPIFETPGKELRPGIEMLADVCEKLQPFPVIGLGGIDESNVASVLDVGAAGFAAIRSLNEAATLRSICRNLRNDG